jgi:hypothetical protein
MIDYVRKIIQAEILSEGKTRLRLTLSTGGVIEGYSWGIIPAADENGEELDYDVLAFDGYAPKAYYTLRDEDIEKVEKAPFSGCFFNAS